MHEAEIIVLDHGSGERGLELPDEVLEALNLGEGDLVEIAVKGKRIVISPIEREVSDEGDGED